jgi:hypothetical protein
MLSEQSRKPGLIFRFPNMDQATAFATDVNNHFRQNLFKTPLQRDRHLFKARTFTNASQSFVVVIYVTSAGRSKTEACKDIPLWIKEWATEFGGILS